MNTRKRLAEARELAEELMRLASAAEKGAKDYDTGSAMHAHALGLAMGYRRSAMWIRDALGDNIGAFAPSPLRARAAALTEADR